MRIKKNKFLFVIGLFFLSACSLSAENLAGDGKPYSMKGDMVTAESPYYNIAGFSYCIHNWSDKTIKSYTMSLHVFDSDGELARGVKSNITINIKDANITADEFRDNIISLDDFFYGETDDGLYVDDATVTKIFYEDGSEWDLYKDYIDRILEIFKLN